MDIDYIELAEVAAGEKPYKGYRIPLEKGYIRLMASKVDREGMVVAINYYGKVDAYGKIIQLNRVVEKRQKMEEFEEDLKRFKAMLERAGLKIYIEKL